MPIVRLKPRGSIKWCPLLKDRKCSVHKVKPKVCAMFPIDRFLKLERDSNLLEYVTVGQTQYIFTEPGCGDNAETHTVREWLGKFGIPLEDEFFLQWHKTIIELSGIFHKEERRPANMLWNWHGRLPFSDQLFIIGTLLVHFLFH